MGNNPEIICTWVVNVLGKTYRPDENGTNNYSIQKELNDIFIYVLSVTDLQRLEKSGGNQLSSSVVCAEN